MSPVLKPSTVAVKHGATNIVAVHRGARKIWPTAIVAKSDKDLNIALTAWVDTTTGLPFPVWALTHQAALPAMVPLSMQHMPARTPVGASPLVNGTVIAGVDRLTGENQPLYLFVVGGGRLWLSNIFMTFNDGSGIAPKQGGFYKGIYTGSVFAQASGLGHALADDGIAIHWPTHHWAADPPWGSIASASIPTIPAPPGVTVRTQDYFGPTN